MAAGETELGVEQVGRSVHGEFYGLWGGTRL